MSTQPVGGGLLEGKVVVITGVGSGLGREVVLRCVADGALVVLGARTPEQLDAVAAEADPSGERVAVVPTDICDPDACVAIVGHAKDRFGGLDGVVQVAAYEYAFGGLFDSDFDAWRTSFETNAIGTLHLLRPAAEALRARGGGSLVLIGSQSMHLPLVRQMGYAASKAALHTSMIYLADELGADHIRVNMVMPSFMWGPPVQLYVKMEAKSRGVTEEDIRDEIISRIPLGEITEDADVANAVSFMLSDRARMITGQTLMVNGGELMR